jgi:hypothetical protein
MAMFLFKGTSRISIRGKPLTHILVLYHSCVKNVVALFHVLEKELEWRRSTGRPEGFETMKASKPIVAIGAEHPLLEEELMADYFRKLYYLPHARHSRRPYHLS